jgi:glycosyltransferase involved in cell wall biosynthesis
MISVIIPAFNRADLIGETLESLLRQTLPAAEIIVVDDGSSDNTAAIAESFGPPVRVIHQANAGPGVARNRGFAASTGEFIHFFDSDDIALPNKQEVQLRELVATGADIAYGPWIKGEISESGFTPENQVLQQQGLPPGDLIEALLTHWSIVPHACLFRRDLVERIGGFPESLFVAEDQLMFLRCLLSGSRVVHSPGTLELYRSNHAGKITAADSRAKARQFRDWARFLCMARGECLDHGIDPKQWFGFRRRAWEASLDLATAGISVPELESQLESIHGGGWQNAGYRMHRAIQRKMGGLQQRITGARGNASFQMGPLTDDQHLEIQKIFRNQ